MDSSDNSDPVVSWGWHSD